MKYSIGDVARTLGLTPAALHFYEKEGVIPPKKGEASRRIYGAEDVIRLISYKKYRSMLMPLREIAQQFSPEGDTCERIAQKLAYQSNDVLNMARRYERMAQDIRWFEQAIRRGKDNLGRVTLEPLQPCIALRVGPDGFISRDRREQERVATWLELMPATRISVFGEAGGAARFGYTVEAEEAQLLGLDATPGAVSMAAGVALHAFFKLPGTYFEHPAMAFEPLWEHMHARGFRQAGTAVGVNLCVECHETERDTLVEAWLPIE